MIKSFNKLPITNMNNTEHFLSDQNPSIGYLSPV